MNNIQQAVVKAGTVLTVGRVVAIGTGTFLTLGKVIAIKNDHVLVDSNGSVQRFTFSQIEGFLA